MNNVSRYTLRRAPWGAAIMAAGLALSGTAHANPFPLKVGVDISGIYQVRTTHFSVVCVLHQGNASASGSAHGEALVRDVVNGQYVGRWKDTLTLMFTDRAGINVNQPGGYSNCSLTLDDGGGANTVLATTGGKFPIAYGYLGQLTYHGQPPAASTRIPEATNNNGNTGSGTGFGGMDGTKLHLFKP